MCACRVGFVDSNGRATCGKCGDEMYSPVDELPCRHGLLERDCEHCNGGVRNEPTAKAIRSETYKQPPTTW